MPVKQRSLPKAFLLKEKNIMLQFKIPHLFIGLLLVAGCSSAPPAQPTYHLSGNVTFNGQPVAIGEIKMETVGTNGQMGIAIIKNGKYDTRTGGAAHSGGKMKMLFTGYDGIAQGESVQGNPLFAEIIKEVELPKSASTMDFTLP
jgi:hypothetical protein